MHSGILINIDVTSRHVFFIVSMEFYFICVTLCRPNLTVESKALTTKVIMEGKRAVGVEFEQDGTKKKVFANKEVCTPFHNANTQF